MSRITAIVLAAGKGSRMNSDVPKQYMELCGKPVLYYSLQAFQESCVDDIVLVTAGADVEYCRQQIVERYQLTKVHSIVAGGAERYWSVQNGLCAAEGAEYVLIHDGARPCITQQIIENSIHEVMQDGACTVGVPVKDTIKRVDEQGYGVETPARKYLWQIQTPQSFAYKDIMEAYRKMKTLDFAGVTDDTMILERFMGIPCKVIMGDYCNLKITTPDDLSLAEIYLKKMKKDVDIKEC